MPQFLIKNAYRGDNHTLEFATSSNVSDHDFSFVVKEDLELTSSRVLEYSSSITTSYNTSDGKTYIYVPILGSDTETLTARTYNYDLYDSTLINTLFNGRFELIADVQTSLDGGDLSNVTATRVIVLDPSNLTDGQYIRVESGSNGWTFVSSEITSSASNNIFTASGDTAITSYNLYLSESLEVSKSLTVAGNITAHNIIELSSLDYKTDVNNIDNQLDNILRLRPVSYRLKNKEDKNYGLIAEEVEEIYPEFIFKDRNIKGINYSKMTAVLVQSIKDLNEIVKKQEIEINNLKSKMREK